ncbi:EthD family reductase [Sphingopyxis sp. KK2]|uniref:EthD family reductase n=1 Tax=Sphingopyxis sp. KK2 TaxID=1855727 RepID=UPI00097E67F2|nr:EthD family reductase [Sphingopyxis sp. KK2]
MLCITAIYPNDPESRFDAGYYLTSHAETARALLSPHGLTAIRTTIGTAALDGSPPPYWAVSEMHFTSRADFDAAIAANGDALFADIPNYTNVTPILQVSELAAA